MDMLIIKYVSNSNIMTNKNKKPLYKSEILFYNYILSYILGYLRKHKEKDKYVFLECTANWGRWKPKRKKIRKITLEWQTEVIVGSDGVPPLIGGHIICMHRSI